MDITKDEELNERYKDGMKEGIKTAIKLIEDTEIQYCFAGMDISQQLISAKSKIKCFFDD